MNLRVAIIHPAGIARGAVEATEHGLRARGIDVVRHATRDLADGIRAARGAVATGSTLLVAAGGDGTVLSVLDACVGGGAELAVLPLGTANDLARHVGIESPEDVVDAITGGERAVVDVGRCRFVDAAGQRAELPFLTTAGVGILADVARREHAGMSAWMKRVLGNACWPLLLGSAWFSSRPVPTRLELDNVRVELDLALFEICKVPTPGGFLLAPDASLDSGILHAWHFGKGTIVGFADDLVRGMAGRAGHLGSRRIEYLSRDPRANRSGAAAVRRIAIVPAEPLSVQVNGDYVGSTPAQFEVRPQSLRLVVPAGRRQSKKD